jgi:hypothetical protein
MIEEREIDADLFARESGPLPEADGYRGIWYYNQPSDDEYKFKYSGGFATYPQQHPIIAQYSPEADRTYFVYGGALPEENVLVHMVSYFDHATGTVPRPRMLLNKRTDDAHDNPVMTIDAHGYIWVFSCAHGSDRSSYVHRSTRPHDISDFGHLFTSNFSYGQPHYHPDRGFLLLHTRYHEHRRRLFQLTSSDGEHWGEARMLAFWDKGHYQTSWSHGNRVGTAFNHHPEPVGLNMRTNLYYMQTDDGGQTWQTASGEEIGIPLQSADNPALVYDYASDGKLIYLKNMTFDADSMPVLLYIVSPGWESGPKNDPRTWTTARWIGSEWQIRPVTTSDNNYNYGPLSIDADGTWRLIAPTEPGPQAYNPGGEMVLWTSSDQGDTWQQVRQLTHGSDYNHTFAKRPVNAHDDFAALWADGHGRMQSKSRLYFTNRAGSSVWRLPTNMTADREEPELLG